MRFLTLLILAVLTPAHSALAGAEDICAEAASVAAAAHDVPYDLMMAVGRVESGRDTSLGLMPWPWTVNAAGDGAFYDTKTALKARAEDLIAAGQTNFDLGCFQVNYGWHGSEFASLDAMFDPATNADYAARFLRRLYDQKGDWMLAAGAYHSETKDKAEGYIAKVEAALGQPFAAATPRAETASSGITAPDTDWFLRDDMPAVSALGSLVKLACSDCNPLP
jgi:hypothetical protein